MNQNQGPFNDAQLRLLLPSSWVDELDTLARIKFKTRLALIRHYLRTQIDQDLLSLDDHLQRREKIKRSKAQTDAWLESRKESDEW